MLRRVSLHFRASGLPHRRTTRTVIALSFCLISSIALASSNHDPAIRNLQYCGQGDLVALGIFTVGEARLYRTDCSRSEPMPIDETRVLEFTYERSIPGSAFSDAARKVLQANQVALTPELQRLNQAYVDVEAGDTYRIHYDSAEGLTLHLNDRELARVEDPAAANPYFNIWLGLHPFDEGLKSRLTGQKVR